MVFIVQLLIVLVIAALRIVWLLGQHLRVSKQSDDKSHLEMVAINKGKLQQCYFGVTQQYGFPFVVRRERWYHRFLKACGLAQEISLGDAALDQKWYFITDYPDHLERALRSEGLRERLKEVLALPVSKIVSTPTRIWCKFECKQLDKDSLQRKKYWAAIEALRDQKQKLIPRTRQGYRLRFEAFGFLALHSALFWFSLVGLFPTLLDNNEIINKGEWIVYGGLFGVLAVAAWALAIFWCFHRTSWMGWVFADFLLVGMMGVFLSTAYFLRDFNIMLDMSEPTTIERQWVKRSCTLHCKKNCGRRCTRRSEHTIPAQSCTSYARPKTLEKWRSQDSICRANAWYKFTLEVPHWHEGWDNYSFEPQASVYDATEHRKTLQIPLHKGAFGMQWVDTDQIQPQ